MNADDRVTELKKTAGDDLKDVDRYALKVYLDERYPQVNVGSPSLRFAAPVVQIDIYQQSKVPNSGSTQE